MKLKKHKVIMLPTNDYTNVVLDSNNKSLFYTNSKKYNFKYQHLYITTDDEIKEGDWCINPKGRPEIFGFDFRAVYTTEEIFKCRKIIATTNKSLMVELEYAKNGKTIIGGKELPQPPKKFIEKYCKTNDINEILVEYKENYDIKYFTPKGSFIECAKRIDYPDTLKINSNNEIIINLTKNSWEKKEIDELCFLYECIIKKDFRKTSKKDILKRIKEIKNIG